MLHRRADIYDPQCIMSVYPMCQKNRFFFLFHVLFWMQRLTSVQDTFPLIKYQRPRSLSFSDSVWDGKGTIFHNPTRPTAMHDSSFLPRPSCCCQYDSHWLPHFIYGPSAVRLSCFCLARFWVVAVSSYSFVHRCIFCYPLQKTKMN